MMTDNTCLVHSWFSRSFGNLMSHTRSNTINQFVQKQSEYSDVITSGLRAITHFINLTFT